jgi:hypothetical protein
VKRLAADAVIVGERAKPTKAAPATKERRATWHLDDA